MCSGRQILTHIHDEISRLNPLLLISDYLSFDDREKDFLAVAQKAVMSSSGPLDVALRQLREPLDAEVAYAAGFYNTCILDPEEGCPIHQIETDDSGSRRYILRGDSERKILFDRVDDSHFRVTRYDLVDLETIARQGDAGIRFIKEMEVLSASLNAGRF
jgi:hypothetical protein